MKIEICRTTHYSSSWRYYHLHEGAEYLCQKEYDYIFKSLKFDELNLPDRIRFIDTIMKNEFFNKYQITQDSFGKIDHEGEGYEWLKNNFGNGIFRIAIFHKNKQELKTIVNKVVNMEFRRGK